MKKIAIITAGILPVPAVKGGAVENLTQFWIENNENTKLAELTVFSCYDEKAVMEAEKFKNTEFIFVKRKEKLEKFFDYVNRVIRKFLKFTKMQFSPYLSDVVKQLRKKHYDYILIANRTTFVSYVSKKCRRPIFLHIHNDYLNNKIFNAETILKECFCVITISDYIKKQVLTIDKNATNISTLKNVIDTRVFSNEDSNIRLETRKKYGIKDDEIVFIFTGRIVPEKGVKELIIAFKKLTEKYDNIKLLIVGDSWYNAGNITPYIEELKALSAGFSDKIIFSGYIDYQVIQNEYMSADVSIVPSIWEEPAGMVVIEAMASGNPLVVSDSGGIPEYVNSDCAITVKRGENFVDGLADAMEKLACDKELRKSMGEAGKKHAAQFDKKDYLKNLLKIIEE